jgi:protein-disulfide isomerase
MQKNINRILLLVIACLIAILAYRILSKSKAAITTVDTTETIATSESPEGLDKENIEIIIKDYLMNNPEVIISAIEKLQRQKMVKMAENAKNYIEEKNPEMQDAVSSPIIGNANGDFIIVVFYDYNCSFCKKGDRYIHQLIGKYNNLKVILKPFPILGENSLYLAKLALSIYKIAPEKFVAIHEAMMGMNDLSKDTIGKLLKSNDIDISAIEQEMGKAEIQSSIDKNFEFANNLGIRGAPAFIIDGKLVPGLIKLEDFERIIEEKSANKGTPN